MPQPHGPLLGLRAAIILLLGALVALGAGVLTVMAGGTRPQAVLAGGAAFAGAVLFFNSLIG